VTKTPAPFDLSSFASALTDIVKRHINDQPFLLFTETITTLLEDSGWTVTISREKPMWAISIKAERDAMCLVFDMPEFEIYANQDMIPAMCESLRDQFNYQFENTSD
jgi:hypothetical protein